MATVNTPIKTLEFKAKLYKHGSWGAHDIGNQEEGEQSKMELYDVPGDAGAGYIEWEIPALDEFESIGLRYEMRDGKRALTDYDGIMALPRQAVELLEAAGIVVDDEFKDWLPDHYIRSVQLGNAFWLDGIGCLMAAPINADGTIDWDSDCEVQRPAENEGLVDAIEDALLSRMGEGDSLNAGRTELRPFDHDYPRDKVTDPVHTLVLRDDDTGEISIA